MKFKEVIAPFVEVRNLMELEKQTGVEEADRPSKYSWAHLNSSVIIWKSKILSREKLQGGFREG